MVKLLLLLLLILKAQATTLVSITNSEGQKLSQDFELEVEADSYIENTKHRWGKVAGWRYDNCIGQTDTRVDVFGANEYLCPDSFTAIKSDVTVEYAAREALRQINLDMDFGKALYAKIRLLNVGKDEATRDAMRVTFDPIRSALFDGDICSARSKIAVIVPDANVTAGNITYVLSLIDAYKTCS